MTVLEKTVQAIITSTVFFLKDTDILMTTVGKSSRTRTHKPVRNLKEK